jgi:hypothetical protein
MIVTGAGQTLPLRFAGSGAGPARGKIAVSLFALSPPPPALGPAAELEAVSVPVLEVTHPTALVTEAGAVYLLQASGAGKVGGGGLGLGDAEYMDWTADGSGKNEGEAGVDFGLGVDEPQVGARGAAASKGAAYQARQRWWGPFRPDHVYYMLFLGTGRPITATYHDSGYGDNSRTDALTFKVFAVP